MTLLNLWRTYSTYPFSFATAKLLGRSKTSNQSSVSRSPCRRLVFSITSDCCDAPTDEDFARGVTKQQLIIEFDEELWEVCSIYPTKAFVSLILCNLGCN